MKTVTLAGFVFLGIILLIIVGTVWYFYIRVKRFARRNFGTDDFQEIIDSQEEELANRPKSVSGMTSLYLPRLQKDFPELNWVEFQEMAESHLTGYLTQAGCTEIRIHQTVLRDYRKNSGTCYAVLQSSAGFLKEGKKIQSRFNVTMMYVQDAAKTGPENSYSVNCPNCGAPITALGAKTCEYCGSAVREVNVRVWRLDEVSEV